MPFTTSNTLKIDTIDVLDDTAITMSNGDTTIGGLNVTGTSVFNHGLEVKNNAFFIKSSGRYYLEEFFTQRPEVNANIGNDTANKHFELAITGSSTAALNSAGGVLLTTDNSGSGDNAIIEPHTDTSPDQSSWKVTDWLTNSELNWECAISIDDSSSGAIYWVGLKESNVNTVATDADQAFFRAERAVDTEWQFNYSINGVDTSTDTGVTVGFGGSGFSYRFRITIDSSRVARFYIDDALVGTSTALGNDIPLLPFIGIQTVSGVTKTMVVHYQKLSKKLEAN